MEEKQFNLDEIIEELYVASIIQKTYLQCLHGSFLAYVSVREPEMAKVLEKKFQELFAEQVKGNFELSKIAQDIASDAIQAFLKEIPGIDLA